MLSHHYIVRQNIQEMVDKLKPRNLKSSMQRDVRHHSPWRDPSQADTSATAAAGCTVSEGETKGQDAPPASVTETAVPGNGRFSFLFNHRWAGST